jgi:hypothetical protein
MSREALTGPAASPGYAPWTCRTDRSSQAARPSTPGPAQSAQPTPLNVDEPLSWAVLATPWAVSRVLWAIRRRIAAVLVPRSVGPLAAGGSIALSNVSAESSLT